jgi:hypothetical protein
MDTGEIIYTGIRLVLGAAVAFCAILVWTRTRDIPWILAAAGAIAAYCETVYSVLELLGIIGEGGPLIGSKSLISLLFPCLPGGLFMAAFIVLVRRSSRRQP